MVSSACRGNLSISQIGRDDVATSVTGATRRGEGVIMQML